MRIGFIGLGIMGKPMAKNLIRAGYDLLVCDIGQDAVAELVKEGATAADSPRDVAAETEFIITMLPNSPEVRDVVLGTKGILETVQPGSIVVDMSSIAPLVSQEIAAVLREEQVEMLDAPVSGGQPKAIDGTLAIMVGGSEHAFERARPVLEKLGASVVRCGDIGAGNVTKLANQIIVALNIAALSEAMVLATKSNVDPETVFHAIKGGLAGSTVMNAKMPLILQRQFEPGFRIELHIKDLQNALDTAHEVGVPVPLTSQVMEFMQALKVDGKAKDDHGGLIQFYEKLAGQEVRPKV
ncbi:MAG: 2-hydroxy-3-oxopropionate reductase [Spirochaetaceae bacterium]|nr:MAG: 2-hydroxy-3-oxopropionate reductase [Spirochaetaceae bacterium]